MSQDKKKINKQNLQEKKEVKPPVNSNKFPLFPFRPKSHNFNEQRQREDRQMFKSRNTSTSTRPQRRRKKNKVCLNNKSRTFTIEQHNSLSVESIST